MNCGNYYISLSVENLFKIQAALKYIIINRRSFRYRCTYDGFDSTKQHPSRKSECFACRDSRFHSFGVE